MIVTESLPLRRGTRTGGAAEDDHARRRATKLTRSRRRTGLLMTLPAIILVIWVVTIPLAQGIYYSFTNWDGGSSTWVGAANYLSVLSVPDLLTALRNSAIVLLSVPIGLIGPFVTAYLLSGGLPGGKLFRTIIFVPTALSWVVIGIVARNFLAPTGLLNTFLTALGLEPLTNNWLADPNFAIWAVVLAFNAAIFGGNTIILLAGFATLDRSMIEAAQVDGASTMRMLVSIILPNMLRFVEFVYITTVITSFTGLFGLIFTMTSGGPGYSSTTLEYAVWKNAFSTGNFGLSAALGIFLLVIVVATIGLSRLVSGRQEESL